MTVYVSEVEDVVDLLSNSDFDKDDTTKDLQCTQLALESDISAVAELIDRLNDWYFEAQDRVREIQAELDEREAAEGESEETAQVETTTT
jgi:hypothetical protein